MKDQWQQRRQEGRETIKAERKERGEERKQER